MNYTNEEIKNWTYFIFMVNQITGEYEVHKCYKIDKCYSFIGGKDNFEQDWNLSYHVIGHTKDNKWHVDITHFPMGVDIQ